jgi:predicted Abi (CAAX) family protease
MKLGISNFHRTVAVFKAATDATDVIGDKRQFTWHYVESADSYIKVQKGVKFDPLNSKFRGAIAWALRRPGRQVTLLKSGEVSFN